MAIMPTPKFKVKFRLDGVLVEVAGVSGARPNEYGYNQGLAGAIENAKRLCLMKLTRKYKGMTIDHILGEPRVVGVETLDAWDE